MTNRSGKKSDDLNQANGRDGSSQFSTPDWAIIILDADSGEIIETNQKAQALFYNSLAGVSRKNIFDLMIFPNLNILENLIYTTRLNGSGSIGRITLNSGTKHVIQVDLTCNQLRLNGRQFIIMILKEFDTVSGTDNALGESEARFQAFFEQSPDAVYILDEDDNILDVNSAACEMLGYTHDEFLQMSSVAECRAPEMRLNERFIVKSELAKARPFEGLDQHKDGTKIPVEIRTGKLIGLNGNLALAIVRDITERKKLTENLERKVTDRMNELAALYEVVEATSSTSKLMSVLNKTLVRVLQVTNGTASLLHLVNRENNGLDLFADQGIPSGQVDQLRALLTETNLWDVRHWGLMQIEIVDCKNDDRLPAELKAAGIDTCIGLPIRFRERFFGILHIFKELGGRTVTPEEQSLLFAIADQIGIAIEITQLRQQLKTAAAKEEKQKLAQNLHDSITQSLYSLTYLTESWRRLANKGKTEKILIWLDTLDDHIQQIIKEMRLLLNELRSPDLKKMSLVETLNKRLDTVAICTGIITDFVVENEQRISSEIEEEIYYIVQESLNNVMKHAHAKMVSIRLDFLDQKVFLSITDDGKGFDVSKTSSKEGMGVENIRERVNRMGGILEISSTPGRGTQIKVIVNSIPVKYYG